MRTSLGLILVGGLLAITVSGPASSTRAAAAAAYIVEDLGTLPGDYASAAWGINESGDVVGWSLGPTGSRAFVYRNGAGMTALPTPAGRPVTTARAINDGGVVVGTASTDPADPGHAVRWQSGVAQDLGTLGTGGFSDARGVNSDGDTVGSSYTDGGALLGVHAFRYTDTSGMVDLTPTSDIGRAEAINDAGQVTGSRNGRAFLLTGTAFTDIGLAFGGASSFGNAINASGQVAGNVTSADGNSEVIFRYTNGVATILGGLGEHNTAFGVNASGDVVGEGIPALGPPYGRQGFLFTDANGMQGLNGLIDPASGWFILGAGDINDAGQIVGWASGPTGQRAVRLTPSAIAPAIAPAAPSGLAGTVISPSEVFLTWRDNSGNEVGFRVERATGQHGTFSLIAVVGANSISYLDGTVRQGKVYQYRVQAYNAAGASAWSNTITVRVRR